MLSFTSLLSNFYLQVLMIRLCHGISASMLLVPFHCNVLTDLKFKYMVDLHYKMDRCSLVKCDNLEKFFCSPLPGGSCKSQCLLKCPNLMRMKISPDGESMYMSSMQTADLIAIHNLDVSLPFLWYEMLCKFISKMVLSAIFACHQKLHFFL